MCWMNNIPPLWFTVFGRGSVADKHNNKVVQGYQKINGRFNAFECLLQLWQLVFVKRFTVGFIKSIKRFLCLIKAEATQNWLDIYTYVSTTMLNDTVLWYIRGLS